MCMWTLLLDGTFMDGIGPLLTGLLHLREYLAVGVFLLFVGLSAMTVMNMLIGVLCEVVSSVAQAEKEEAAISLMKKTVLVFLRRADADGNGDISKDELRLLLEDAGAMQVFDELHVDVEYLMQMQEYLFDKEREHLSMKRFMDLILTSRGDRPALMRDLIEIHFCTCWRVQNLLNEKFDGLCCQIQRWLISMMAAPRGQFCL